MHTLLPAVQRPAAHTAHPSPRSAKKHLQLSLALLFSSFIWFLPILTLPLVPWITALLSLLCFSGALLPSLPELLLPPDCVQPWCTRVTDLPASPCSSSQPVCRRASGFMEEDRATWGGLAPRPKHAPRGCCSAPWDWGPSGQALSCLEPSPFFQAEREAAPNSQSKPSPTSNHWLLVL